MLSTPPPRTRAPGGGETWVAAGTDPEPGPSAGLCSRPPAPEHQGLTGTPGDHCEEKGGSLLRVGQTGACCLTFSVRECERETDRGKKGVGKGGGSEAERMRL